MKTSPRYYSLVMVLLSLMLVSCSLASTEPIATQAIEEEVEAQRNEPVFIDARSDPSAGDGSVQALSGGPPPAQSGYVQPAPVQYQPQPQYQAQSGYQNTYYIAPSCVPRYDWSIYYVRQGDTLARVASWYGTTAATLAYANCIGNPNLIYAGQAIRVPYYNPPRPPHHPYPPYPNPPTYPPPYPYPPTPTWTPLPPTAIPPVVIGTALSISPFAAVNNNVYTLNPGDLVTFSWNSAFPTATIQVAFEMIAPTGGSTVMGIDSNLGDGASIVWNAVSGLQGTVRAIAAFAGGYPPQASDSVYVIVPGP